MSSINDGTNFPMNKPYTEKGISYYDTVLNNQKYKKELPNNHYSKIKTENMYVPKNQRSYAEGGQTPQEQNPEMQMVQQILQAVQQLSPEGHQMLMQQMEQMESPEMQQQEQQSSPDQYMPPQQRMGGMQNKGFLMLPRAVQQKIMNNS